MPGEELDSCVVCFFLLLFGLALALLSWLLFCLCFFVVGGLAPGLVLAWSFQFLLVTILVFIF